MALATERGIIAKPASVDRHPSVTFAPDGRIYSGEFPTAPQERTKALLNMFSTSPRAITFLLIPIAGEIQATELESAFKKIFAGTKLNLSPGIVRNYASDLLNNGLIKERIAPVSRRVFSGEVYYSLTEEGKRFGLLGAVSAVDFERKSSKSLKDIFGPATATKGRPDPQMVRAHVLKLLDTQGPMSSTDIVRETPFVRHYRTITRAIAGLNQSGAINYERSASNKDPFVSYQFGGEEIVYRFKEGSAGNEVILACNALHAAGSVINVESATNLLDQNLLEQFGPQFVRKTLGMLVKRGYIKRVESKFIPKKKLSEAEITELGKHVVEFLDSLAIITDDNFQQTPDDLSTITRIEIALASYADNSGNLYESRGSSKHADNLTNIVSLVQGTKNGLSINDMSKALSLPQSTVYRLIKELQAKNVLRSETSAGINFYFAETLRDYLREIPDFPSFVTEAIDKIDQFYISFSDKISILAYYLWALSGSPQDVSRVLGLSPDEMDEHIKTLHASEELEALYDTLPLHDLPKNFHTMINVFFKRSRERGVYRNSSPQTQESE